MKVKIIHIVFKARHKSGWIEAIQYVKIHPITKRAWNGDEEPGSK